MKTSPLSLIFERIRSERQLAREVPGFDPQNGNETARFLFVLDAPDPKAFESGVHIARQRGAKSTDVKQGLQYLTAAVAAIENLQCIVLVGGAARLAHIHLSQEQHGLEYAGYLASGISIQPP